MTQEQNPLPWGKSNELWRALHNYPAHTLVFRRTELTQEQLNQWASDRPKAAIQNGLKILPEEVILSAIRSDPGEALQQNPDRLTDRMLIVLCETAPNKCAEFLDEKDAEKEDKKSRNLHRLKLAERLLCLHSALPKEVREASLRFYASRM